MDASWNVFKDIVYIINHEAYVFVLYYHYLHFSPTIKVVAMVPDQVVYNSMNKEKLFSSLPKFHWTKGNYSESFSLV